METPGFNRPITLSQWPERLRHPSSENRIVGSGDPDVLVADEDGRMKTGAHDSDDGERTFVEIDGAADEMGIGAEAAAPEFFADDRDGRGAGPAVFGSEGAAHERRDLKDVEEPGCNDGGVRDERFAAAGDGEIVLLISGQFGEARCSARARPRNPYTKRR